MESFVYIVFLDECYGGSKKVMGVETQESKANSLMNATMKRYHGEWVYANDSKAASKIDGVRVWIEKYPLGV